MPGRIIPGVRDVVEFAAKCVEEFEVTPPVGRQQPEGGHETRFAGPHDAGGVELGGRKQRVHGATMRPSSMRST